MIKSFLKNSFTLLAIMFLVTAGFFVVTGNVFAETVLSGIGVTARTTSTNGDKITVGDVTGSNKDYAVAITQNGELATVTS
ncbi:MAG: hypothetical protein PHR33_01935, partial [Bacilli bacterium]|nr:hypothetical protein [Bacilli bacterium]